MGGACDESLLLSSQLSGSKFESQIVETLELLSDAIEDFVNVVHSKIEQERACLTALENRMKNLRSKKHLNTCLQEVGVDFNGTDIKIPRLKSYKPIFTNLKRDFSKIVTKCSCLDAECTAHDGAFTVNRKILSVALEPRIYNFNFNIAHGYHTCSIWNMIATHNVRKSQRVMREIEIKKINSESVVSPGKNSCDNDNIAPTFSFPENLFELFPESEKCAVQLESLPISKPTNCENLAPNISVPQISQFSSSKALLLEIRQGKKLTSTSGKTLETPKLTQNNLGLANILFDAISTRRKGIMAVAESKNDVSKNVVSQPTDAYLTKTSNSPEEEEWNA